MDESKTQFQPQASWSWGDAIPSDLGASSSADPAPQPSSAEGPRSRAHAAPKSEHGIPGAFDTGSPSPEAEPAPQAQQQEEQPRPQRHYRPRTCRICLDEVLPTFDVATEGIFGANSRPRVRYVSDDPELGRLMSPCRCKGSQRYVHEGCLKAWRQAAPLSDRNFWCCPTCGFRYRMSRLRWASWLTNRLTRLALTISVLVVVAFVLGFVADPIINLYVDPWGSIFGLWDGVSDDFDDLRVQLEDEESFGWYLHFLKGIVSLSLVGAVQAFTTMSPFTWWQIRTGGFLGGGTNQRVGGAGRRGGGRDRMENINLALVLIGLFTVLAATWKLVSALSARALQRISEGVMDIPGGDDEDDDEEAPDHQN